MLEKQKPPFQLIQQPPPQRPQVFFASSTFPSAKDERDHLDWQRRGRQWCAVGSFDLINGSVLPCRVDRRASASEPTGQGVDGQVTAELRREQQTMRGARVCAAPEYGSPAALGNVLWSRTNSDAVMR